MSQLLPDLEEARALVPAPGSATWRLAGDARLFAASGYAVVLQIAHPTVANGVREHSLYSEDPYGRLLRTLDYVNLTIYGGPEAAWRTGRALREMHKRIKGVAPDGTRYHALEPEAFAWVHGTLVESIAAGHRRFGRSLADAEVERLYGEWRRLGRILGVREGDLPETWREFEAYRDRMIAERLEPSDVIDDFMQALARPDPPPVPFVGEAAWRVARPPAARVFRLATIGLLPARLQDRLGLRLSRGQEAELRGLAAASRAAGPLLPRGLRCMGPSYLRWRREAIGMGDMAAAAPALAPAA
jgi:uncharacterized protein (DUF2236 family)